MIPETENPPKVNMSVRVSLRGIRRLIRVDHLRRVNTVGLSIVLDLHRRVCQRSSSRLSYNQPIQTGLRKE